MKNTPHDELFTQFMGYPETAKSFLSQYLPDDLLKRMDMNLFKDITQKIHDEKMRDYYTDLVFKTKVDEYDTYLCFLFEHKSYLDKNVSLQILRYMTLVWEKAEKEDGAYPLILPILFYHGEKDWNADKISLEITYLDDFNTLLQYIIVTIDFSHDELISLVKEEIPERRKDVMTIAEELRAKGKREGIKEGKREGKREGKIEMAKTMLNNGMSIEQIIKLTNLEGELINLLKNEIKH